MTDRLCFLKYADILCFHSERLQRSHELDVPATAKPPRLSMPTRQEQTTPPYMLSTPFHGDERQLAFCALCGGGTGTRDHCPSRVLLDEPYPDNLPVVPACSPCNSRFSADEQYLACLISCVLAGSTDPALITPPKIRRILSGHRHYEHVSNRAAPNLRDRSFSSPSISVSGL